MNSTLRASSKATSRLNERVSMWKRNFGHGCGGAGMGNVKDQMIANTEEHLFRHTKRPKTVSIIG